MSSAIVADVRFYDDLDPTALDSGAINFHADGYSALWAHCRKNALEVLADIHTHPGTSAAQSWIDRKNPMIPVRGHVAIVLPNFARVSFWSLRHASIYEYEGDYDWRRCNIDGALTVVKLCFW
jgi:proteasome lid subunit RPN8/RPN11